tara:strand:+ start:387 stop:581 length:195 start_codon:yes stop_codon:yes gene_type:complete
METLNLADSIAQLKVLKWQYEETSNLEQPEAMDVRQSIIRNVLKTIGELEVPQLIGTMNPNDHS